MGIILKNITSTCSDQVYVPSVYAYTSLPIGYSGVILTQITD